MLSKGNKPSPEEVAKRLDEIEHAEVEYRKSVEGEYKKRALAVAAVFKAGEKANSEAALKKLDEIEAAEIDYRKSRAAEDRKRAATISAILLRGDVERQTGNKPTPEEVAKKLDEIEHAEVEYRKAREAEDRKRAQAVAQAFLKKNHLSPEDLAKRLDAMEHAEVEYRKLNESQDKKKAAALAALIKSGEGTAHFLHDQ